MIVDDIDAEVPSVAPESEEPLERTEPTLNRYELVHAFARLWRQPTEHPPLEFFAYLGEIEMTCSRVTEMWKQGREKQQNLQILYDARKKMALEAELEEAIAARARAKEALFR